MKARARRALVAAAVGGAAVGAAATAETISYRYDARGRLVKVERIGGAAGASTTRYTFDRADNRTSKTVTAP